MWDLVRVVWALLQQLPGFGLWFGGIDQLLGVVLGRRELFCFLLSNDFVHYPSSHSKIRELVSGMLIYALGVALRQCRVPHTNHLFHSLITRPSAEGVGDKYILGLARLGRLAGFVAGCRLIVCGGAGRLEISGRALAAGSAMVLWVVFRVRKRRVPYSG